MLITLLLFFSRAMFLSSAILAILKNMSYL